MRSGWMIGLVAVSVASTAQAQWVPGSELIGQEVEVETNGVRNTVLFRENGVAEIRSPSGATVVNATWRAGNGQLCMQTSGGSDCYAYNAPFMVRSPVVLTSDCGTASRFTARSTAVSYGERG